MPKIPQGYNAVIAPANAAPQAFRIKAKIPPIIDIMPNNSANIPTTRHLPPRLNSPITSCLWNIISASKIAKNHAMMLNIPAAVDFQLFTGLF
jgi:hypothetical protein